MPRALPLFLLTSAWICLSDNSNISAPLGSTYFQVFTSLRRHAAISGAQHKCMHASLQYASYRLIVGWMVTATTVFALTCIYTYTHKSPERAREAWSSLPKPSCLLTYPMNVSCGQNWSSCLTTMEKKKIWAIFSFPFAFGPKKVFRAPLKFYRYYMYSRLTKNSLARQERQN